MPEFHTWLQRLHIHVTIQSPPTLSISAIIPSKPGDSLCFRLLVALLVSSSEKSAMSIGGIWGGFSVWAGLVGSGLLRIYLKCSGHLANLSSLFDRNMSSFVFIVLNLFWQYKRFFVQFDRWPMCCYIQLLLWHPQPACPSIFTCLTENYASPLCPSHCIPGSRLNCQRNSCVFSSGVHFSLLSVPLCSHWSRTLSVYFESNDIFSDVASLNCSFHSADPCIRSTKAANLLLRKIWNWACVMGFISLLVAYCLDFASFFSCILSFLLSFGMARWWSVHTSAPWYTCTSCRQGILHLGTIPIWSMCFWVLWSLEVQVVLLAYLCLNITDPSFISFKAQNCTKHLPLPVHLLWPCGPRTCPKPDWSSPICAFKSPMINKMSWHSVLSARSWNCR